MKRKLKIKNVVYLVIILTIIIIIILLLVNKNNNNKTNNNKNNFKEETIDFKNRNLSDVKSYLDKYDNVIYTYQFSDLSENIIIDSIFSNNSLELIISKGSIPYSKYKELKVNELGKVPIMMYHGIVSTTNNKYTGGNVDKDGYNRTSSAFRSDLEFYYSKGYRMISLKDYVNGIIDVEMGYSPIILTFDDGNMNNFKVIDKLDDGTLVFDPDSAIGILESFKEKYPDFNITATFFLNSTLCNQEEYNEDIIKWLVNNGYDVGNHTLNHDNFTSISISKTQEVVGGMYNILDSIIPGEYVNIVALPYGSPYKKTHENYAYILNGEFNSKKYETVSALRVGWESEVSPFNKDFDKTFLKRCRAYDNNGVDFDIEMNFKILDSKRYISDGDINTIVIPDSLSNNLNNNLTSFEIITYKEDL